MDIWDNAIDIILDRMKKEGMAEKGKATGLFKRDLILTTKTPKRTDDGAQAVPFLKVNLKGDEPKGRKMSREEMLNTLLERNGSKCQGCGREFDDPRYLELDHNTLALMVAEPYFKPNPIMRALQQTKKQYAYFVWLRRQNKKMGYMVKN